MSELEDILDKIAAEQREVGEAVASGAPSETIALTAATLLAEIGTALPEASVRFLSLRNGLDFNGLSLHRCDTCPGDGAGLVAGTLDLELGAGVLVLGSGDMDIFIVSSDGVPARMDRVGGDVAERFAGVEAMLVAVLKEHLRK